MQYSDVNELISHLQKQKDEFEEKRVVKVRDKTKKPNPNEKGLRTPRMLTKDELRAEMKYKTAWKGSGCENAEFQKPAVMKPKILNGWEAMRATAPDRSLKAPKGSKPFLGSSKNDEFGSPSEDTLPKEFQTKLAERKKVFRDRIENPDKYEKIEDYEGVVHPAPWRLTQTKTDDFQFDSHSTWEKTKTNNLSRKSRY
mmetsp:Transcript_472/g.542  ORF Transcript_472/g.542 Transcript_472/m.542 type:complete len:198 (+) Transcript_472:153-746(+)